MSAILGKDPFKAPTAKFSAAAFIIGGVDTTDRTVMLTADPDGASSAYVLVGTNAHNGHAFVYSGTASTANVYIGTRSSSGSLVFRANNSSIASYDSSGIYNNLNSGNETTAAGSALLGSNCPAVTVAAPYKWIKFKTSDGSLCYFPVWK